MVGQGRAVQATVGQARERKDRAGRPGKGRVGPGRQGRAASPLGCTTLPFGELLELRHKTKLTTCVT